MESLSEDGDRGYPRRKINMDVDAASEEKIIQSHSEDISGSGVYIRTPDQVQVGQKMKIVFSLPNQTRPFKIDGKVVRTESRGVGLRFMNISPHFRDILDSEIWRNYTNA